MKKILIKSALGLACLFAFSTAQANEALDCTQTDDEHLTDHILVPTEQIVIQQLSVETQCPNSVISKNGKWKFEITTEGLTLIKMVNGLRNPKWSTPTDFLQEGKVAVAAIMGIDGRLRLYGVPAASLVPGSQPPAPEDAEVLWRSDKSIYDARVSLSLVLDNDGRVRIMPDIVKGPACVIRGQVPPPNGECNVIPRPRF